MTLLPAEFILLYAELLTKMRSVSTGFAKTDQYLDDMHNAGYEEEFIKAMQVFEESLGMHLGLLAKMLDARLDNDIGIIFNGDARTFLAEVKRQYSIPSSKTNESVK